MTIGRRQVTIDSQAVFVVGAILPIIEVTIRDSDTSSVINLTGETLKFAMWPESAIYTDTPKVNYGAMTLSDPTAGKCTYAWVEADVDTAGTFRCTVRSGTVSPSYTFTDPFIIEFRYVTDLIGRARGGVRT